MTIKYKEYCPFCKDKTQHLIFTTNRKRGAKLYCLICDWKKTRYKKFNLLEEWKHIPSIKSKQEVKND